MAHRRQSLPWLSQPPAGTPAAGRWRAAGMSALFDVPGGREVISGVLPSVNALNSSLRPRQRGIAGNFPGNYYQEYADRPDFRLFGPMSIVVFGEVDSLTNYSALVSKAASPTTHGYEMRLGYTATDSYVVLHRANANGYTQLHTGSNRVATGRPVVIVATAPSGVLNDSGQLAWVDGMGAAINQGSYSASGGSITDTGAALRIARRSDSATQLTGGLYYVALFQRSLSMSEIHELTFDPWSVFEPDSVLVPKYAATSLPTLSSATYAPGSLTSRGFAPRVTAT